MGSIFQAGCRRRARAWAWRLGGFGLRLAAATPWLRRPWRRRRRAARRRRRRLRRRRAAASPRRRRRLGSLAPRPSPWRPRPWRAPPPSASARDGVGVGRGLRSGRRGRSAATRHRPRRRRGGRLGVLLRRLIGGVGPGLAILFAHGVAASASGRRDSAFAAAHHRHAVDLALQVEEAPEQRLRARRAARARRRRPGSRGRRPGSPRRSGTGRRRWRRRPWRWPTWAPASGPRAGGRSAPSSRSRCRRRSSDRSGAGVARNTSAPKRDMSWRGSSTAIISMAQQARPNCIGQIAERRAQLKTLS